MRSTYLAIALTISCLTVAFAKEMTVPMHKITKDGVGESVGTITIEDSPYGLLLKPNLKGLNPGLHGFHVHEKPSCGSAKRNGQLIAGLTAGGHYDPQNTRKHEGPYGSGHLGDLPPLYVDNMGEATLVLLAPRLKSSDLQNRALIIHAGSDNFSDTPQKLGGGGAREVCGLLLILLS